MASLALVALAALALSASAPAPLAHARERPERPLPLLPDYVPYPSEQSDGAPAPAPAAAPAVRAVRSAGGGVGTLAVVAPLPLAPRAPRAGLIQTCLADFWWGIKDSAGLVVDTAGSCMAETVDEAKFLAKDVVVFGDRMAAELRDAVTQCAQAPGRCVSLLLSVARAELKPFALLAAAAVRLAFRLIYSAVFDLLGCTLLPALLPAVWNTLMDVLILAQCALL